jgi:hypothetical protein
MRPTLLRPEGDGFHGSLLVSFARNALLEYGNNIVLL